MNSVRQLLTPTVSRFFCLVGIVWGFVVASAAVLTFLGRADPAFPGQEFVYLVGGVGLFAYALHTLIFEVGR